MELHDRLAAQSGNSWAAWRQITPRRNALVEAMLTSPAHVIATMRTETVYAQVSENGKAQVKKLGLEPVQRDGMDYEFTLFLELRPRPLGRARGLTPGKRLLGPQGPAVEPRARFSSRAKPPFKRLKPNISRLRVAAQPGGP